jgi:GcrA cell cycle regulator
MTAPWDEERMKALTRLWMAGETARMIAEKLGGSVTRNAVIGKAPRLGLTGKHGSKRLKRARALRAEGKRKPKNRAH